MNDLKIHSGACFCGAVQIKVSGAPALPLHDGLPKMKDLPTEAGGSGITLA
jgi:hypothetical protein